MKVEVSIEGRVMCAPGEKGRPTPFLASHKRGQGLTVVECGVSCAPSANAFTHRANFYGSLISSCDKLPIPCVFLFLVSEQPARIS